MDSCPGVPDPPADDSKVCCQVGWGVGPGPGDPMIEHSLHLTHERDPLDVSTVGGHRAASSTVEVWADSDDLTECWSELLSRLPNDVYRALKVAMGVADEV